jgi:hypothetical protein
VSNDVDIDLPKIEAVSGHCFFKAGSLQRGPVLQPPHEAIVLLLNDIDHMLAVRGLRPVVVTCEAWPVPKARDDDAHTMAMITIGATPGRPAGASLRSWFQWQHARWKWASRPFPVLEHESGVELLGHS